jgi:hypothetical protein
LGKKAERVAQTVGHQRKPNCGAQQRVGERQERLVNP